MAAVTAKVVLQQNQLFRNLPESALDKLTALSTRKQFPKNRVIFSQGQTGDTFYGVISGCVRISVTTPEGQETHLKMFESGDSFGEIAILDGKPRTAEAVAIQATEVVAISRDRFWSLLESEPQLSIQLLKLLCEKLRWTSELIEDATFLDLPHRLAKRLHDLADGHGKRTEKGLELKLSQLELANYLGVTRQIVNQYLQEWRELGWIRLSRGKITIADMSEMEAYLADRGGALGD